ncbi:Endoribonuclease YbeY [Hartmannibacter diazotrophicus]|uniref:Endoribonuclease YbeY n=1 Tax=Hartmannibacter diazotrophicus TaxID=1482074 RepID=A0A2C9DD07_9HYPH|nr:rRNA maturation RNase YbeY [Hartmannibacter diazotrophicus]SON58204.1 Endoribonuclease YbeY [Hartmannibacter diazotrophicus]
MVASALQDTHDPLLSVDLAVEDEGWLQGRDEASMAAWIEDIAAAVLGLVPETVLPGSEVAVVLTDDASIREINREHRGFDKPTNVLSFPMSPPDAKVFGPMVGDIVVARETVEREAAEAGIPFDHHFTHMIVHGILHLLGYDHIDDAEAEEMEGLETAILAHLAIPDPYADSEPA